MRILVGVDGSESSSEALRWALAEARRWGPEAEVQAEFVYAPDVALGPYGLDFRAINDEIARNRAGRALSRAVRRATGPDFAEVKLTRHLGTGHAGPALVKESEHADLLVVGSRGHGRVAGTLIGSVSLHCVTKAHCPVVVVRSRHQPTQS